MASASRRDNYQQPSLEDDDMIDPDDGERSCQIHSPAYLDPRDVC